MARIQANGVDINYELTGAERAPVVVLSHSLGCSLAMWDGQMAALTDRWRVLRYDTRGHGQSGVPAEPYSIGQLADDVVALLDALELETVHFCGLSLGGTIGQTLALQHRKRLASLILCATASHLPPPHLWQERAAMAREQGMVAVGDAVMERWFTEGFREQEPARAAAIRQLVVDTAPDGYANCCLAIRNFDVRDAVREIELPTLVIVGADDPATPPSMAQVMAERISGARLEVIEDAAHLVNIQQEAAFNDALVTFLGAQ